MAKTKQPQAAIDTGKLQQLLQKLAQYGPGLLAVLQRLVDVLQSKQGTGGGSPAAQAPAGAGADVAGDALTRVIDHQVASLAELVYLRDYLAQDGGNGGGTTPTTGGGGGTAGTGQPTQPGATVGVPTIGQQPKKP